ncbi:MAG TPA: RNA polymerase sigma-70 factor [Flavisolibacter sp.]
MPPEKNLYLQFESVFKAHYNALANYAFSILKSEQDAEDVVQEVFIRVWQNTPDVISTDQVKFYLVTAVKNGCISFLRKQAGKVYVQPEDVQLHRSPDEAPAENSKDPMELVDQALALLPPQCQVIFKMSRFGKLTYQQIADELGLSVKTVENQVGKALKIMRDFAKQHNLTLPSILLIMAWGLM